MKDGAIFAKELAEDLNRLDRSVEMLKYSLQRCCKIGIKKDYSLEELDRFESIRSRAEITCTVRQPIHPLQGLASPPPLAKPMEPPPLARIRSLGRFAPDWRRSSSLTYQRVCALLTPSHSGGLTTSLLYKLFMHGS